MNPERVDAEQSALAAHLASLQNAISTVTNVRLASLNPLNYGIPVGALVLTPAALISTTAAIAHLHTAKANAESMIGSLSAQVAQQREASGADSTSYYSDPKSSADAETGVEKQESEPWWMSGIDIFEKAHNVFDLGAEGAKTGWGLWFLATSVRGVNSFSELSEAGDWAMAFAPKAVTAVTDFVEDSHIGALGTALGYVGAGLSLIKAGMTWADPKSTTWDKTRDTVGAVLGVAGAVALAVGLASNPVGWVILGAGLAWGLTSLIVDNHVAIGKWIGEAANNVGNAVSTGAKAIVNAGQNAAKAVSNVAANVVKSGENFFGGITHGLGIGWP
jgi:hypothetical protein